ncbi:MAG: putative Ig domain-containing protein, partial [Myxococcales bacterium]|nr:putative Ig domain-containing protein [Myxococcales bacterium]
MSVSRFAWLSLVVSLFAIGCGDDPVGSGTDSGVDGGGGTQDGSMMGDGGMNEGPSITSTAPTTATVDEPYEYTLAATGTGTVRYSVSTGPAGMTVDESTGVVSWTPDTVGTEAVLFQAKDDVGTADQMVTIVVSEKVMGALPVFTSTPPTQAIVGVEYVYDADADSSQMLTWSLPVAPTGMTIDSGSGEVSWTPSAGQVATHDVTVRATNVDGGFADQEYEIVVNPENSAPIINSMAQDTMATVGVPFVYDEDNRASAVYSGTSITWSKVSGPTSFNIGPSGVIAWTPVVADAQAGQPISITIRATDDQNRSSDQTFMVTVGQIPVITPIDDFSVTEGDAVSLTAVATPSAGVTWELLMPSSASIDGTGLVNWNSTGQAGNTITFEIRATNAFGVSSIESFDVTVNAYVPEPASITSVPPATVFQGEVYSYDATAVGAATIAWQLGTPSSGTPAAGIAITTNPATGGAVTLEWDTTAVSPGAYTVALEADNDDGDPDVQEFTVTVLARPPVPVIDLGTTPPPTTVFVGSAYSYDVNLTAGSSSAGVVWTLG